MSKTSKSTKEIGYLGETIVCEHLLRQGFEIIEVNYARKWGEIDVIASKEGIVHFIEVKTVSYETRQRLEYAVLHETYRPEELVHARKLHQIEKALGTWISDKRYEGDWVIDVAAVRVVPRETYATVNFIENVVK